MKGLGAAFVGLALSCASAGAAIHGFLQDWPWWLVAGLGVGGLPALFVALELVLGAILGRSRD